MSSPTLTVSTVDWDLPPVPTVDPERGPLPSAEALRALESDPRINKRDLEALREWLQQEQLPETADFEMVKFLHSCDYDVARAKKCMKGFYTSRVRMPELFSDWDLNSPQLKSTFELVRMCIVPRKTPENYRVLINCMQSSDTSSFDSVGWYKALMMIMETFMLTEPTLDGLFFINDFKHFTFRHIWKINWTVMRKIDVYTAGGMPVKREAAHILNASGFMERMVWLMKHISRSDDIQKTHIHRGNDLSALHQKLPLHCLPSDLGGTLPSTAELHEMTLKRLEDFQEVFKWQLK